MISRFCYGGRALVVAAARTFATRTSWRCALLDASASHALYSSNLDLNAAAAVLREKNFLWSAAEADAAAAKVPVVEYFERVWDNAERFMKAATVHDREAPRALLRAVLAGKRGKGGEGNLALVLGGKSVGKTFLMRKLRDELHMEAQQFDERQRSLHAEAERLIRIADCDTTKHADKVRKRASELQALAALELDKELPRRVLVYNARSDGADLTGGLMAVLADDEPFYKRFKGALTKVAAKGAGSLVELCTGSTALAEASESAASAVADAAMRDKPLSLKHIVVAFVLACKEENRFPCIVIEEANAALVAETPEARERTVAALRLLTEFTKEERLLNVVLTASEHSEPYRLNRLGFKSDHWTSVGVISELAPVAMRQLLREQWGMGEHLTDAVMSVWGGHVWGTYKGLEVLERGREAVKALDNTVIFSLDALRGAANCTQAERKLNLVGMKKLLEEVARRGYAPFKDFDDARVMLGSESNVLAVVMESVAGISVPDSAFTRSVYAATPASQGMRLMLANALKCEEGDDKEQPLQ